LWKQEKLMAKAPAPPLQADDAAVPAPKKGKKLIVILMIVLVVVLLAVVGVVSLLLLKKGGSSDGTTESVENTANAGVDLSKPPTFVALDPFVVNLAPAEGDRFLQVVMALRVADPKTGDGLKGYMPEIRHRTNLLLSSKLPSELSTLEGREDLAEDIRDQINEVLGFPPPKGGAQGGANAGPIHSVLFNSFIIQ
jgi:flagellar FliL protein